MHIVCIHLILLLCFATTAPGAPDGIAVNSAPPVKSDIINRPPAIWGQYKFSVIAATAAMAALVILVAALTVMNRRLKRLTMSAHESEVRFRVMIDRAPEAIVVYDVGLKRIIDANPKAERLFGCTREELLQGGPERFYPPRQPDERELAESFNDNIMRASQGEEVLFERNIHSFDGRNLVCEVRLVQLPYLDKQWLRVSFIDITERKRAETALRMAQFSLDHSSDGIFWMTPDAKIVDVNEAAWRSLGYSREELLQLSVPDIDPLFNNDDWQKSFAELRQLGSQTFETEHMTKEGARFPVEIVTNYLQFGAEERNCAFVRMISERRRSEDALRKSEAYFRSLFENSFVGVMLLDRELIFTEVNKALCTLLGYDKEELIGRMKILDVVHPDDVANSAEIGSLLVTNQLDKTLSEKKYVTKAGNTVTVLRHVSGIYNHDGDYEGSVATVLDITALRKIEEEQLLFEQQLQHTQKLESLGVLSGGIAHDFNNILAVIIGYCGLTKMNYETAEENILEIEKAAERAAGLCHQMLAYAGKAHITRTTVNMVAKVDDIVAMLKTSLPQNAVIKADLSNHIPLIEGDASQLRQVVMNLIINASEALGTEQGEVQVSLARINVVPGKLYEDYHGRPITPGDYVCLEVSDNGCGMDETTKRRIFEPFYTTKFTGRGLGMSAVLGIINSHGGALQLFSRPGVGSTFKVYLPLPAAGAATEENRTEPAPAVPWKGSGTILLVEDEDAIRNIAKAFLEIFGFTVLEAANGKEALERHQSNAADIRLVVTDMGMPVMDGYELFYELKKRNPGLPVIITSGFGDVEVSSRIGSDNIAGLISKPYNPGQLREVLQKALEEASPPGSC